MESIIIPLNNEPIEKFSFALDGLIYKMNKQWFEIANSWTLDILGTVNNVKIKTLALTTNVDLLVPHAILELGKLILIDLEGQNIDPNYDDFGKRWQLFYIPKGQL